VVISNPGTRPQPEETIMNTQTRSRIARTAAFAVAASITAVTTTVVAAPTTASAPGQERPCFIIQPRWSTAIDGPAPTCPTPSWQGTSAYRWGTPGSSAGTAPRRTGTAQEDQATVADRGQVNRRQFDDEYGQPTR